MPKGSVTNFKFYFMLRYHFAPNLRSLLPSLTLGGPTMVTTRRSTRLIESSMTQEIIYHPARPIKRFKTLATSAEATTDAVVVDDVPARKKKATKEEPRPDEYRRRVASSWKVGAHVSAAGGVENAVQNAAAIG
jgi:AP endonuclease-1